MRVSRFLPTLSRAGIFFQLGFLVMGVASAQPSIPKERISADMPGKVRTQLERLYSEDAKEKCAAAKRLGRMGHRAVSAVPFLVSMLGDESSYPRFLEGHGVSGQCAAFALADIGSPAFEPLATALTSRDPFVRKNAAVALGMLRDPRAIGPLTNTIKEPGYGDETESPSARERMVWALGELRAIDSLAGALQDEELRLNAASELASIGRQARPAVPSLIRALTDSSPVVQEAVAEALVKVTGKNFGTEVALWQQWWNQRPQSTRRDR
jgi:HEAT repeat protein